MLIPSSTQAGDDCCPTWCNAYTCNDPDCKQCDVCYNIDVGNFCAPWCNEHTCDVSSKLCKGCGFCSPSKTTIYLGLGGFPGPTNRSSSGGWPPSEANNDTSTAGNSLADGGPTTLDQFIDALHSCADICDVYINFHTNYSWAKTEGFGLARSQLQRDPSCYTGKNVNSFLCWKGVATTANTNIALKEANKTILPEYLGSFQYQLIQGYPTSSAGSFLLNMKVLLSEIPYNTKIVGVHLHTGSNTTNGPVNIIFCGDDPLPGPLQGGDIPSCSPVLPQYDEISEEMNQDEYFEGSVY